jgi:hypothetical protein
VRRVRESTKIEVIDFESWNEPFGYFMNLFKTIPLPNGLFMEVWDTSRPIAINTVKVGLMLKVKIEIKPEYFENPDQFETTRKIFGADLIFEYNKERSFVEKDAKDAVFTELLDEFKENSLAYISRPTFPSKLAKSKYLEIQKHPYKYQPH